MADFFTQFVEFRNWGWNITSISFLGTIIFGIVFGWGLWKQINTIRLAESGKSIPMVLNVYLAFHFFTFSVYGFRIHSLAMILNGVFGLLFLRIYFEAGKWPDSDGRTKLQYVFVMLPLAMVFIPNPSVGMGFLYIPSSLFLLQSPLEILEKKDAGSVEPKYILCFIASATFWMVFSACISEWALFTANVFGIGVMLFTLALWKKYPKPVSMLSLDAHVKT